MNRFLNSILTSTMLLSLAVPSFATECTIVDCEETLQAIETQTLGTDTSGWCGTDIAYSLDASGVLTLSGTGAMNKATYYGQYGWYKLVDSIKTVLIPEGVTTIGSRAFSGASNLTSVNIPSTVTGISSHAFKDCISLPWVVIPDSVTSIGEEAFQGCSSFTTVTIPDSVKIVDISAFTDCTALTTVQMGNSVNYFGSSAFSGCTSLATINIPESVTSIPWSLFQGCTSLSTVTIPNSVKSIGSSSFEGCTSLYWISIPDSVTSIDGSAFKDCTTLTTINIPNSVTTIGYSAFSGCTSLTTANISATKIGDSAFYGCTSLTTVAISDTVTSIGNTAFMGCDNLTSIYIPDTVTSIGTNAFDAIDKTALKNLTVYGYTGSRAELFCIAEGIKFEAVGTAPDWTDPGSTTPPPAPVPTYNIKFNNFSNGTVNLGQTAASEGDRVTMTVNPNYGFFWSGVSVKDQNGTELTVGYDWTEEKYAFVMPAGDVTITPNFVQQSDTVYTVGKEETEGGTFTLSNENPKEGDEITITTNPTSGYSVSYVSVTTSTGQKIQCNNNGNGTYSYRQPSSSVKVSTSYQYTKDVASTYTDVNESDWYSAYVAYVTDNNYMSGIGDGNFAPDNVTTRGMVALILALANGAELSAPTEQQFTDVPVNAWFASGIAWCKETGVMMGHENGSFGADDPVTQEQMATIFRSYARYLGQDADTLSPSLLLGYADCTQISSWAVDSFAWALGNQYFQGTGNLLNPTQGASRAEFANILNLFMENN